MSAVERFMAVYQHLFNPLPFIVFTGLLFIVRSGRRKAIPVRSLLPRLLTIGVLTTVALVPMVTVIAVTDVGFLAFLWLRVWYADPLLGASLFVASAFAWYVWTVNDWGEGLQIGTAALTVAAFCYGVITPFWNVSGHVAFTVVPALSFVVHDRSYWPLLVVPVVMIPNRPLLGVHTWPETVGGIVLGVGSVLVAVSIQDRVATTRPEPTSP